jgi:hypothetical protein
LEDLRLALKERARREHTLGEEVAFGSIEESLGLIDPREP